MLQRIPDRDCSILTPRQYRCISSRANRVQERNNEPTVAFKKHQKALETTSTWKNTIKRNRLERQTRLQKEQEQEELRKKQIDEEIKKYHKLQKEAALATARKAAFQQRPEVRDVNSRLLLAECIQEREEQTLFKEQRKIAEMRRQIQEDEEAQKRYEEMCEKERQVKMERRRKAILTAQAFRDQRDDKIRRKMQQKEEDYEDDMILRQENERLAREEKERILEAKRKEREFMEASKRENSLMQQFKKRKAEIEKAEDLKILNLTIQTMDEEDRRRDEDKRRRMAKTEARQKLIDLEAERQKAQKKKVEDFLQKQLDEQYAKETKHIQELQAQRTKMFQERRNDMLETMRLQKLKRERQKRKQLFPQEEDPQIALMFERQLKKMDNAKEIAAYQRKQAQEKKEREAAEVERERLEFQAEIEKQEEDMEIARQYAEKMIAAEAELSD